MAYDVLTQTYLDGLNTAVEAGDGPAAVAWMQALQVHNPALAQQLLQAAFADARHAGAAPSPTV